MCRISSEEILLWRREQLAKGGNTSSIDILLECLGGISHEELNLIKLKSQRNFLGMNIFIDLSLFNTSAALLFGEI